MEMEQLIRRADDIRMEGEMPENDGKRTEVLAGKRSIWQNK